MSKKFELTWIKKEHQNEPRVRVEFPTDPQREDSLSVSYEATLGVCSKPRCVCSNILIEWHQEADAVAPANPPVEFWFNLKENFTDPSLKNESLRLAEILCKELTETDRLKLREWFLSSKLQIIETTPVNEFDLTGLPNADEGEMIGFADIFPCGLTLNFELNDEQWGVDEQYCVQRNCGCKETILSFLKRTDTKGQKITEFSECPSIRYNYESQMFEVESRGSIGSPPVEELLTTMQRAHPEMDTDLTLRHLIMQSLYLRQELEQAKARLRSLPSAHRKIGRNEPCLCGSGRKYKQCCLNKI